MEIKVDMEAVARAMSESATAALTQSLGGYEVQKAVAAVVSGEIVSGTIGAAIKEAVRTVDHAELTKMLAAELQRATTRAVITLLREGLLKTVCSLRDVGDYSAEDKAERARIRAELFS